MEEAAQVCTLWGSGMEMRTVGHGRARQPKSVMLAEPGGEEPLGEGTVLQRPGPPGREWWLLRASFVK